MSCYIYVLHLLSFPTRRSSDLPPDLRRRREGHAALEDGDVRGREAVAGHVRGRVPQAVSAPTAPTTASDSFIRLAARDRKSTRLNSSHLVISYAVFCLKKKIHK